MDNRNSKGILVEESVSDTENGVTSHYAAIIRPQDNHINVPYSLFIRY